MVRGMGTWPIDRVDLAFAAEAHECQSASKFEADDAAACAYASRLS